MTRDLSLDYSEVEVGNGTFHTTDDTDVESLELTPEVPYVTITPQELFQEADKELETIINGTDIDASS